MEGMNVTDGTEGGEGRVPGRARGREVCLRVDGRPVRAFEGESVAAALFAAGQRVLRTAPQTGAPRGVYCGIGLCFECVMVVDGRPGVRTCRTPVRDGMRIDSPPDPARGSAP